MKATLIYHAIIRQDDTIDTLIFPDKRGQPQLIGPRPLPDYSRSQNLKPDALIGMGARLGYTMPSTNNKRRLLEALQSYRGEAGLSDALIADELAETLYSQRIAEHREWLPPDLQ